MSNTDHITVCETCNAPVVFTCIFPGKEFFCVKCKRAYEFCGHGTKLVDATAALDKAFNEAEAEFEQMYPAKTTGEQFTNSAAIGGVER